LSYGNEIGAALYDFLGEAGDPAFMGLRREVIGRAEGVVVEIGSGTGRNFPHYHAEKVTYLYAIEPDLQMARRAVPRADGTDLLIEFMEDDA
jgi:SAM-dependent methyltransferase